MKIIPVRAALCSVICVLLMKYQMKDLLDRLTGLIATNPRENKSILVESSKGVKLVNPWKHLPNTENFYVMVNELDPLLMKHGIARKFSPELKFDKLSHRLSASNRYLDIQFAVLVNLLQKGQALKFWHRAMMLLSRSKVLRLVALRKLQTNWGRTLKFGTVKLLLQQLETKIQNLDIKIAIRRDYVDKIKPDGTKSYRPIGAPSYSDRMLLYLLSCFFVIFLGYYIGQYQHAYRPGKGVVSCWQDLNNPKSQLKDWPNIYEFDLKGFFPSVNVSYCMSALREIGLPADISEWIFEMSLSYPDVTTLDESKLDETNAIFKHELDMLGLLHMDPKPFVMTYLDSQGNYTGRVLQPMMEFIKANGVDLLIELMSEDLEYSKAEIKANFWACCYEYWQVQSALFESFAPAAQNDPPKRNIASDSNWTTRDQYDQEPNFKAVVEHQIQGFPQGGALSPILSIFAFEYALKRGYFDKEFRSRFPTFAERSLFKLVAYADDFIVLCKEKLDDMLFQTNKKLDSMGISFNKEKSGWIRKDGIWQVDSFKFLGATYYTKLNLVKGTPRSGKDLLFDKHGMIEDFVRRDESLKEIDSHCRWGMKTQEILDAWGNLEEPYCLIPEEIIATGRKATSEELTNLQTATWTLPGSSGTSGINFVDTPNSSTNKGSVPGYAGGLDSFGGGWLSVPRLAGFIMNRLHSGTWQSINSILPELDESGFGKIWFEDKVDTRFDPKPRSWAGLVAHNRLIPRQKLTMSNLSSYCTLSLLENSDIKGRGIKISRNRIKTFGIFEISERRKAAKSSK